MRGTGADDGQVLPGRRQERLAVQRTRAVPDRPDQAIAVVDWKQAVPMKPPPATVSSPQPAAPLAVIRRRNEEQHDMFSNFGFFTLSLGLFFYMNRVLEFLPNLKITLILNMMLLGAAVLSGTTRGVMRSRVVLSMTGSYCCC